MIKLDQSLLDNGRKLPLVEEFYTLQGEGIQTGTAAYFIRLGGCDVGCSWCDTKHSWNPTLFPPVAADEIVARAAQYPAKAVVVTGGEPSTYPLQYFTARLKEAGIKTYIETSGAYSLTGDWDWICLSPKKNAPPVGDIHQKAHELKVVIHEPADLEWAEYHAGLVEKHCYLLLQPEWSRREQLLPQLIDYIQNHPQWRLSLQVHKWLRIP